MNNEFDIEKILSAHKWLMNEIFFETYIKVFNIKNNFTVPALDEWIEEDTFDWFFEDDGVISKNLMKYYIEIENNRYKE